MEELINLRFISKKDEWFDENTEARLICLAGTGRLGSPSGPRSVSGLFSGWKDGRIDEEICCFTEFEIVDEAYFTWSEAENIKRVPRMYTDKETGKELTLDEALEKIKQMTDEEKLDIIDQINKQLGIKPLKKSTT